MALKDYSTTPANNNAAPPNGDPEGMAAASVNNSMRQIRADVKAGTAIVVDTKATMTALDIDRSSEGNRVFMGSRAIAGDGGIGIFRITKTDISTEVTADPEGGVHIPFDSDGTGAAGGFIREITSPISARWFGATGDGSTDDTTALGAWFDYLIANTVTGELTDGTYLLDFFSKSANSGFTFIGNGTIKATGSNRLNMMLFTAVRGPVVIGGNITIDANDKVAKPLDIENSGATTTTLGSVYIGPNVKITNAKNNTPDTFTANGILVRGGFSQFVFNGEIDVVDSTSTSGAVTAGVQSDFFVAGAEDYIRETIITGNSRIRNIKNSNTVTADADGVKFKADNGSNQAEHLKAVAIVQPGALFDECEGRAIKSQVVNTGVDGAIIRRTLFNGLTEINLQFAGGYVRNCQIFHDATSVSGTIISITQRDVPDVTHCNVVGNILTTSGTIVTPTVGMIGTDVTSATVENQGIVIRDNKVFGQVDHMITTRNANVVDVNRMIIDGNWVETISGGGAFIKTTLFGSSRAQLTIVFTNNGCENGCTGADITDDLIVEYAINNDGITALQTSPFSTEINASGVAIVHGRAARIDVDGGAASSDNLDTITIGNRGPDDWIVIEANNSARTIVVRDESVNSGNIELAGAANFSMTSTRDRLVLAPSISLNKWVEISRSSN